MTFLEQVGRSAIGYAEDAGALTIQFWTVLRNSRACCRSSGNAAAGDPPCNRCSLSGRARSR